MNRKKKRRESIAHKNPLTHFKMYLYLKAKEKTTCLNGRNNTKYAQYSMYSARGLIYLERLLDARNVDKTQFHGRFVSACDRVYLFVYQNIEPIVCIRYPRYGHEMFCSIIPILDKLYFDQMEYVQF